MRQCSFCPCSPPNAQEILINRYINHNHVNRKLESKNKNTIFFLNIKKLVRFSPGANYASQRRERRSPLGRRTSLLVKGKETTLIYTPSRRTLSPIPPEDHFLSSHRSSRHSRRPRRSLSPSRWGESGPLPILKSNGRLGITSVKEKRTGEGVTHGVF